MSSPFGCLGSAQSAGAWVEIFDTSGLRLERGLGLGLKVQGFGLLYILCRAFQIRIRFRVTQALGFRAKLKHVGP